MCVSGCASEEDVASTLQSLVELRRVEALIMIPTDVQSVLQTSGTSHAWFTHRTCKVITSPKLHLFLREHCAMLQLLTAGQED
jgi:hypothetical protein